LNSGIVPETKDDCAYGEAVGEVLKYWDEGA